MILSRLASLTRSTAVPLLACLLLCLFSLDAAAEPRSRELVSSFTELFSQQGAPTAILNAAKRLFWMLATMSLVWSMGVLLLRRADFGEFFLELFRFMLFTGLFYWLLTEASTADGFVYAIFDSFKEMSGVGDAPARGDTIIQIGLDIYYKALEQSQNWGEADTLVNVILCTIIVVALTLLAAQIVLMIVMAWMLAYAGVFLLGMGGARWTSPIAISFYKHVLALGAALLLLVMLLKVGQGFLEIQAGNVLADGEKGLDYVALLDMFVTSLLMSLLGIKLPGLIYTMVTGSPLGLLAGTAGMAGSAIATGGGNVYSTAYSTVYSSRDRGHGRAQSQDHGPAGPAGDGGSGGAVEAIRKASSFAQMDEAVFEPFGHQPHAHAGTAFPQGANEPAWNGSRHAAANQAASARGEHAANAMGAQAKSSPAGQGVTPAQANGQAQAQGTASLHTQSAVAGQAQAGGAPMPGQHSSAMAGPAGASALHGQAAAAAAGQAQPGIGSVSAQFAPATAMGGAQLQGASSSGSVMQDKPMAGLAAPAPNVLSGAGMTSVTSMSPGGSMPAAGGFQPAALVSASSARTPAGASMEAKAASPISRAGSAASFGPAQGSQPSMGPAQAPQLAAAPAPAQGQQALVQKSSSTASRGGNAPHAIGIAMPAGIAGTGKSPATMDSTMDDGVSHAGRPSPGRDSRAGARLSMHPGTNQEPRSTSMNEVPEDIDDHQGEPPSTDVGDTKAVGAKATLPETENPSDASEDEVAAFRDREGVRKNRDAKE